MPPVWYGELAKRPADAADIRRVSGSFSRLTQGAGIGKPSQRIAEVPAGARIGERIADHLLTESVIEFATGEPDAVALGQRPPAFLTMLYRSTDGLCRGGAPMQNLAHSASFDWDHNDDPSKRGIKHLGPCRGGALAPQVSRSAAGREPARPIVPKEGQ